MDYLKKRIVAYVTKYDMAISEFERKTDLGNAVVSRMLNGKVKNPSIDTVLKIASVLECSLDELFINRALDNQTINKQVLVKYNIDLFRSICFYTIYFTTIHSEKLKNLTFIQVINILQEIYEACQIRKLKVIDIKLAEQMLRSLLAN